VKSLRSTYKGLCPAPCRKNGVTLDSGFVVGRLGVVIRDWGVGSASHVKVKRLRLGCPGCESKFHSFWFKGLGFGSGDLNGIGAVGLWFMAAGVCFMVSGF